MKRRTAVLAIAGVSAIALTACGDDDGSSEDSEIAAPREFSGMAWLASEEADDVTREVFLVAHDLRDDDEERDLPRLSIVKTPVDPDGISVAGLDDVGFPSIPNDLESVAPVPDRNAALLVESNADGEDPDPTIYLATWDDDLNVEIAGSTPWPDTPEPLVNVEATAVAQVGGADRFLYAEREEGSDTTRIHMTDIEVSDDGSISFGGQWTTLPFTAPEPPGARPASGMDVDSDGNIYLSSAFDPGDLGPFDSAVWRAATVEAGGPLGARLRPVRPPEAIGFSNGLKIEAVALVDGDPPIFIGDDDEDYGGLLRQFRIPDSDSE